MYKYNDKIESLSKEQNEVILRNENSKNLEKEEEKNPRRKETIYKKP